jgi:ubiquinone biosynthesis protein Coq4
MIGRTQLGEEGRYSSVDIPSRIRFKYSNHDSLMEGLKRSASIALQAKNPFSVRWEKQQEWN